MVTLLTTTSSASCRLAKKWLEEHQIPFIERDILADPLSTEEVKAVMRRTENGTDDIISKRSKTFLKLNVDIDALALQDLFTLLSQQPGLLLKPIIFDDKRFQVGYREEEMRKFLPRQIRSYRLQKLRDRQHLNI